MDARSLILRNRLFNLDSIFQVLNIINFGCATWILIPPDYGRGILHGVKRMRRSRVLTEIPAYGGHRSFTSQVIIRITCYVTCSVVVFCNFLENRYSGKHCADLNSKVDAEVEDLQKEAADAIRVPVVDTICSVQDIRSFRLGSSPVPKEIELSELSTSSSLYASCVQKLVQNILWFQIRPTLLGFSAHILFIYLFCFSYIFPQHLVFYCFQTAYLLIWKEFLDCKVYLEFPRIKSTEQNSSLDLQNTQYVPTNIQSQI